MVNKNNEQMTRRISSILRFSVSPFHCKAGFSLLELIVVLAIITMLAVFLSSQYANITRGAGVTCALEEMANIKIAITDMFYPDLGRIPEDPKKPWFSTRYLCLRDDRDDSADDPDAVNDPECYEMWAFLGGDDAAKAMLVWDRYKQKGWRGPYMEQDTISLLEPNGTQFFPLIATPWADKCENVAGKYYLIVTDRDEDDNPIVDTARIVCFGPNCVDDGSYKNYKDEDPNKLATAEDLRKPNIYDADNSEDEDDYYYTGDDIVMFIFGGGCTRRPEE